MGAMREMRMQTGEDSFLSSDSCTVNMRESPSHPKSPGRRRSSRWKQQLEEGSTLLLHRSHLQMSGVGSSQGCAQSLAQVYASPTERCSHVVGHVDGVQLVCQEGVPQVHPLLLTSGVDGDHPWVHNDHNAHNQVVLL